jgi:hypothetical protein
VAGRALGREAAPEGLARFLAGGSFGLLIWWLNEPIPLPVEEADRLLRRLAIPALKAVSG